MKFWIDRRYPWRIWFGKPYYKGKYNWIDIEPKVEGLKIGRHFKDSGRHEVFIRGLFGDYKLEGEDSSNFTVTKLNQTEEK